MDSVWIVVAFGVIGLLLMHQGLRCGGTVGSLLQRTGGMIGVIALWLIATRYLHSSSSLLLQGILLLTALGLFVALVRLGGQMWVSALASFLGRGFPPSSPARPISGCFLRWYHDRGGRAYSWSTFTDCLLQSRFRPTHGICRKRGGRNES